MIQLKSEMYKVKQHTFCRMHLLSEKQSLLTGKRIVFPYTMTAIAAAAVFFVRRNTICNMRLTWYTQKK